MSWPVSDEFDAALRSGGFEPIIRLTVLDAGVEVASTDTISTSRLEVLDGSVQAFNRADVRRSFSVTLSDVEGVLIPLTAGDILDPVTGNEVKVEQGLRLAGGDELIPQGVFRIETAEITDELGGVTIVLTGMDRAHSVAQNHWREPYTIVETTNTATAIHDIVVDRLTDVGTIVFNFAATTQTVEEDITLGEDSSDPWKDASNLAAGIGMELYWDQSGVCVLRPVPDPDTAPVVLLYEEGEESILLDPIVRSADRSTLRNGAIVFSEAPWLIFPILAAVWDDDPTSPTRRGLIGEFPEKVGDPTVFDEEQCELAAAALFLKVKGVEEQIRWSSIPYPALDVGDVIQIAAPLALGGTPRLSIESLEIPLEVGAVMSGTTRRRRT